MRDLLVYLDSTPASQRTRAAALELAHRTGARVLGLFVITPVRMPGYVAAEIPQSTLAEVRKAVLEHARQQELALKADADEAGVTVEWRVLETDASHAVNTSARAVDLVVLPQPEGPDPSGGRSLIDDVVLGSGRPVLMVPHGGAPVGFGEHVLVAWNNSCEATGALHDALPMLKAAKRVVLASADNGDHGATDLDAIVAHLSRHGVAAETRRVQAGASKAGDALLALAADEGIDLMVMGAWGHSRMREMILGGVTAHIIRNAELPVFMSH